MLRYLVLIFLFWHVSCVISSASVYNATEPSHVDVKISGLQRDKDKIIQVTEAGRSEQVGEESWFVNPPILPLTLAASDFIYTTRCRKHNQLFLKELKNFTLWATQMFDAVPKLPVGLLAGNQFQMGHFDECVEISVDTDEKLGGPLKGQYCLAEIKIETSYSPTSDPYAINYDPTASAWEKIKYGNDLSKVRRDILHWALCMPDSCSPEELNNVLRHELQKMGHAQGIRFTSRITSELCHTQIEAEPLSLSDTVYLIILVSLILLVIISTWYDMTFSRAVPQKDAETSKEVKRSSKMQTTLLCFSARRNMKKLLNSIPIQPAIDASHGPRLLFMLFIIMGHRITTFGGHPIFNAETEEDLFRHLPAMILANGPLIVDGFFALSGVLLSYPMLVHLGKTEGMNLVMPIIVRFIRLTPSYLLLIFFHATLLPHMGSGPFWDVIVRREQERCATNWWTNVLYINNYINVGDMCMFQSWYVAADFHLYIISLLLVYTVWRWPRVGYTMLGLFSSLSVVIPFILIYQTHAAPLLYPYPDNIRDVRESWYFQSIYVATHNRAAPYFVGVIIGILLYKIKNTTYKLSKIPSHIAYFACVWGFGIGMIMSAYTFFIPGRQYSALEAALYGSLQRVGFATAVACFFIIITLGQIDIHQQLFASKPFVVLSRLTYGAYLVHTMGQTFDQGSLRIPRYLSVYTSLWFTLGDVVFAFSLSLFLLLLVEAPFRSLEKVIFGKT